MTDDLMTSALAWLRENGIATLNVAGPRESKRPGIQEQSFALLSAIDAAVRQVRDKPQGRRLAT
ncbi:MAG: putative molybdenum carrier protein [Lysobacterales bacterium]